MEKNNDSSMRQQFVPTNFERTQALKCELRELVERGLDFIDNAPQLFLRVAKYKNQREILLWAKRERAFQKQREQEEREKFEKEMRDKEERKIEEKLRKEKEEKHRKEYDEKERVRQEEELKRKEVEIERKERKEIMLREVEISHSTLLCKEIKIKLLKGVILSLNFVSSSINSFVLVLSKNVFPPSFTISNSLKDFTKPNFDLELPFRFQLSQSENHNFCEMGTHFSKLKSPSHIFCQYLLHGLYDFTEIMFDDCCRYVFDPGETQL